MMPFGLWAQTHPRNRELDEDPDPPWEVVILGEMVAHCKVCRELCRNGWTDGFVIWVVDSGGPKEAQVNRIRQVALMCTISIIFASWHQCTQQRFAVSCAKTAEPIDLPFGFWIQVDGRKHKFSGANVPRWEGTLAPPAEYDWTVHLRQRCGLMSNYFDHLLWLFWYRVFTSLTTVATTARCKPSDTRWITQRVCVWLL